jgi:histidinol-phosphate/aromatic aminotransferase/cobyric acid decarboxylase-like protein
MLKDGVLIRSLAVHHARRSYLRVTVGTRQQNDRCVAAFERVLGRQMRRETPRPFLTVAGDAE